MLPGKLYVVGTPIGNLSDISKRALETLSTVDFIAAEDTRVTVKLLNRFNIKKAMISYFEHNKKEKGMQICQRILAGENCALVTDAGMPCISDPGEDLVRLCIEQNIETVSVPGPSALLAALSISGQKAQRFAFEGFLSVNKKNRISHLNELKYEKRTMIFYEAPHKLKNTLKDFFEFFGDRELSIVREITKRYETVIRTTTKEATEMYDNITLKGEIVLILSGLREKCAEPLFTLAEAAEKAKNLILNEGLKTAEAARIAAEETGVKKNLIYKELLINDI